MNTWTPFTERMPPPRCGFLLVTNNVYARDAFGHHSHVWLVSMVHTHERAEKIAGRTYAEAGEITAFSEPGDQHIRNLTHWRFALPEESWWPDRSMCFVYDIPDVPTSSPPLSPSPRFLFWQLDNPTSLVCGRLHPRHYLEQVLGLHVLEYRGSLMGGFICARVAALPSDLTLPEFLREVEGWPDALKEGGDR